MPGISGKLRFAVSNTEAEVTRLIPELARAAVKLFLTGADPVFVNRAELVASELVTNAVRYGSAEGPEGRSRDSAPSTSIVLKLDVTRADARSYLRIRVYDTNEAMPKWRLGGPYGDPTYDENGRGLVLVEVYAERVGSKPTPGGKVVYAELLVDDSGGRGSA